MEKINMSTHEREAHCQVHGAYTERGGSFFGNVERAMWFGCSPCNVAARAQEEAEATRKKESDRQARIEARLKAAGIPMAFRDRTFDSFKATTPEMMSAVGVVREFAEGFWERHYRAGTFLVLGGEPGTGKSHLAIAATPAVMARGTAMYMRAGDLIRRVRATWSRDSDQSEADVLRLFGFGLDLLIIDEVGVQRGTEDEQRILFDVLDQRYAELRPTILLTNLTGDAFKEFLGPRIMDRLRERAVFVPFRWESYRGRHPS
jgi:DNA replication protein DnaC